MRKVQLVVLSVFLTIGAARVGRAHEGDDLPAGPIRDRHELMHGIGDNAKVINDAVKAHDFSPVAGAAEKIEAATAKILPLFPQGSTDPKSRAKPEIWTQWPKFEEGVKQLQTAAAALSTAAKNNGDVPGATKTLFGACKSCHDPFRVPEKEKS
ncbi:MAG TPA: cytochrome c [Candidatus Acidoferrales bacterium]|nr:cytochrome c [Candidatus Acidoferrales bacterium]